MGSEVGSLFRVTSGQMEWEVPYMYVCGHVASVVGWWAVKLVCHFVSEVGVSFRVMSGQ